MSYFERQLFPPAPNFRAWLVGASLHVYRWKIHVLCRSYHFIFLYLSADRSMKILHVIKPVRGAKKVGDRCLMWPTSELSLYVLPPCGQEWYRLKMNQFMDVIRDLHWSKWTEVQSNGDLLKRVFTAPLTAAGLINRSELRLSCASFKTGVAAFRYSSWAFHCSPHGGAATAARCETKWW